MESVSMDDQHGYDSIDNRVVGGIIETDLGNLIEDAERLRDKLEVSSCWAVRKDFKDLGVELINPWG
jgi:hypothetical protein